MDDLIDLPDEKPEEIPPEELPPKAMLAVIRFIDHWIGEWSGKIFAWFIIPLVGGLVYEVFARYLFNAPTIWESTSAPISFMTGIPSSGRGGLMRYFTSSSSSRG